MSWEPECRPGELPPASEQVPMQVMAYTGGKPRPGVRVLAAEVPVNLIYGSVPHAVMMATPVDLEDFACGFSLTEGIVEGIEEIRETRVETGPDGVRLHVELAPGRLREHLARKRAISGRTGCGVCGIEDLSDLPWAERRAGGTVQVTLPAIARALSSLDAAQKLGAETRAVHAAAWARLDGSLVAVREDVGRHNALDKLIGALMRAGTDTDAGFLVITSRCSFEMVEKAARLGAAIIVAISAPTALALERARAHAITLCAIARADTVTIFTGAERLIPVEPAY
ncbi:MULTISPECIES: formate dehydrogenase accessory sulfurtransferase FdhD [Methylobacterium]|uniref:Sulfur carrier protein FdhD n=1 Tax=Methylobacterium longum TaxID=767694 RepID=A0ABT8AHB8_9HYPH|nr:MULTISPECIES: formate dehydrogenase accessory sulfurtransferase FdhD [Methylobacterium]MCJ2100809.1 formate dehydrogenase accessory sulfurtransferase FdhD [Methylobacterium sp. E-046]MDN3569030.1 formate dehydrogenase accessory sulfurtransferase FdhD [Methylobacterium longum]GJE10438.1 Sulfur carrier protein FdhD [Methylobacterium longum]